MNFKAFLVILSLTIGAQVKAQVSAQDSAPAAAANDKLKISGIGRLRYENQENTISAAKSASFMSFRLRPNLTYKASEDLEVVLEPQFSKRMGSEVYSNTAAAAGDPTATPSLGESSGSSGYPGDPLTVFQAYMNVKLGSDISLKAGRQVLKYGDELILGPANWGLYGRSFDAAVLHWENNGHFVDAIHAKLADFGTKDAGGERELNGVYTSWALNTVLKTLEAYFFQRNDTDSADTANSDNGADNVYNVVGTRLLFGLGDFGLTAEYAHGDGSDVFVGRGTQADMYDVLLNYKVSDAHKLGLRYAHAGSDWNELYPTTNSYLGRSDVVGRRNLQAIALHYNGVLSETVELGADLYHFDRANDKAPLYRTDGTTSYGSLTSSEKAIGDEINLVVKYKQSSLLTWSAGAAYFIPGAYIKDSIANDSQKMTFGYVMLEAKY